MSRLVAVVAETFPKARQVSVTQARHCRVEMNAGRLDRGRSTMQNGRRLGFGRNKSGTEQGEPDQLGAPPKRSAAAKDSANH